MPDTNDATNTQEREDISTDTKKAQTKRKEKTDTEKKGEKEEESSEERGEEGEVRHKTSSLHINPIKKAPTT